MLRADGGIAAYRSEIATRTAVSKPTISESVERPNQHWPGHADERCATLRPASSIKRARLPEPSKVQTCRPVLRRGTGSGDGARYGAITIKLIGYAEVVRCLHSRLGEEAAVVLFGGMAKDRPYPGSTMVTTHNAGISGLVKTLAVEIAPHRVNGLHPGVVGDSPRWRDLADHPAVGRTPTKRLVTMADVADATEFLLRNPGVNGVNLPLEGGTSIT